jgi:predicted nucleic acid-binding protein
MRRISFDTNIVISILTNNQGGSRNAQEWDGIIELVNEIDQIRSVLVVPTIIFSELLPSHLGRKALDDLERFFKRNSVELCDLTYTIARRPGELRDSARLASGKVLKSVDSVFVATAEIAAVDTLYSCDKDIYNVQGARTDIQRPMSPQISLLPSSELPTLWSPQ